ncbi:hypothetical protein [Agrobacterium tumefaciens]|jgi:hypothetical protein|uniref:hypothetical protein n=1 Tax=Agrobacterium tumefaciens TaxID=358 RepID=UPI000DD08178|nr:hypothetical protein [Agrobacterium tumefaciens]NSZ71416.1 hypothetical protein [Agrobacterium tumefaciens]UXR92963.1 hypothetical protein FY157_14645 [Agrobacterium tumefaciens]
MKGNEVYFKLEIPFFAVALCVLFASPVFAQEGAYSAARSEDNMTVDTKCEAVNQAAANGDQLVVQEMARLIIMANLDKADVVKAEFKEGDVQRLFQLGFDICDTDPNKTIGLAARDAFAEVYVSILDSR